MPDDGLLVDFIPHIAPTPELQQQAAGQKPDAPLLAGGALMPLDKPYLDIPGTTIFDAEQARKGYWLNQFCMSLMRPENRARFKADERAYLDEWPMTEAQKQAVLARDLNAAIAEGGNIYFLAKLGSTDGRSFQQMAASMTGMTEARVPRHDGRGRPVASRATGSSAKTATRRPHRQPQGQRHAPGWERRDGAHHRLRLHQPRAGHRRRDRSGTTQEPYWRPLFAGYEPFAALAGRAHRPTSSFSSTTTTPPPSASTSSPPSPSAPRPSSSRPTRGGARGRSPRSSVTPSSARTSRRA